MYEIHSRLWSMAYEEVKVTDINWNMSENWKWIIYILKNFTVTYGTMLENYDLSLYLHLFTVNITFFLF